MHDMKSTVIFSSSFYCNVNNKIKIRVLYGRKHEVGTQHKLLNLCPIIKYWIRISRVCVKWLSIFMRDE